VQGSAGSCFSMEGSVVVELILWRVVVELKWSVELC